VAAWWQRRLGRLNVDQQMKLDSNFISVHERKFGDPAMDDH
jgi:hypothetical protein